MLRATLGRQPPYRLLDCLVANQTANDTADALACEGASRHAHHARWTIGIRMRLPTTERRSWHGGAHTAKPESASSGRFLVTEICWFLWHVVPAASHSLPGRASPCMVCRDGVRAAAPRLLSSDRACVGARPTQRRALALAQGQHRLRQHAVQGYLEVRLPQRGAGRGRGHHAPHAAHALQRRLPHGPSAAGRTTRAFGPNRPRSSRGRSSP